MNRRRAMLRNKPRSDERLRGTPNEAVPDDEQLREEFNRLAADAEPRQVNRALQEAVNAVNEAAGTDIHDIKMIEAGRCPECHGRTERLLSITVCPTCGWTRRAAMEGGRCTVHLRNGDTVACDRVFHIQNNRILCVTDDIVQDEIGGGAVERIEYGWDEQTLQRLKAEAKRSHHGVCAWCDAMLDEEAVQDGEVLETYIAMGAVQERHLFCSQQCFDSFKRQYPSRVHRNCYETDCSGCDQCIKRYSAAGYRKYLQP
ncbi:MAG: hypothetical protein GF331_21590 [Chitinivibrionales bacterium]|nr:hypothetical protein [Chitinivibrionales bacterium]